MMSLQDTVGHAVALRAGQSQQVLSLFAVEVGAAQGQAFTPALQICV